MLRSRVRARAALAFGTAIAFAAWPVAAQQPPASTEPAQGSLAQRLASGAGYVIITRRDLFPRPSEGADPWFVITGYYVPQDGTWTSNAPGFSRRLFSTPVRVRRPAVASMRLGECLSGGIVPSSTRSWQWASA